MTSSSSGSNESTETSTSAGPGPDLIDLPHSGDSNSDMLTIPGKEPNVNRAFRAAFPGPPQMGAGPQCYVKQLKTVLNSDNDC